MGLQAPVNLTLTVGARYYHARIHDTSTVLQDVFLFSGGCGLVPNGAGGFIGGFAGGCVTDPYEVANVEGDESKPSYNYALLWKPVKDISLYVRAASGFRIGGLNTFQTRRQSRASPFREPIGRQSLAV